MDIYMVPREEYLFIGHFYLVQMNAVKNKTNLNFHFPLTDSVAAL